MIMALINCTECGKEVSTEAVACPNCGAARPRKSIWMKVIFVVLLAIGLFTAAGIYAGSRMSREAVSAVKERLHAHSGLQVTITKYRKSQNLEYDFVCGVARYREAGAEKTRLFMVTEQGVFPSVVSTMIEGDTGFDGSYFNTCV